MKTFIVTVKHPNNHVRMFSRQEDTPKMAAWYAHLKYPNSVIVNIWEQTP